MAEIKKLLDEANIGCSHWIRKFKKQTPCPIPLLIFNSMESNESYISKAKSVVRKQQTWKDADETTQEAMLAQVEAAVVRVK
jgi:hypothetical protein